MPRYLRRPPYCALESTWTLWTLLHDAMAAHDPPPAGGALSCLGCTGDGSPWSNGSAAMQTLWDHDATVRGRIEAFGASPHALRAALSLVGSGPWRFRDAGGAAGGGGGEGGAFFFLRGGQLHTPWGSAAWAASTSEDGGGPGGGGAADPLVVYLCGREKWTHSLRIELAGGGGDPFGGEAPLASAAAAAAAAAAPSRGWAWLSRVQLVLTSRAGGDVQLARLEATGAADASSAATAPGASSSAASEGRDAETAWGAAGGAALLGAIFAQEDHAGDADAPALHRRLLGTGPWAFGGGGRATAYFLARGAAFWYDSSGDTSFGSWAAVEGAAAAAAAEGGAPAESQAEGTTARGAQQQVVLRGGASSRLLPASWTKFFGSSAADGAADGLRLAADCWRLRTLPPPGKPADEEQEAARATLVWSHPASRCFPTCSDATHTLTAAELAASDLARGVSEDGREWTWSSIAGMRFKFDRGDGGVLVTPWGHGTWGITPTRTDVLVAEFAQQRHMLKFDAALQGFVSTRCADGEVVRGGRASGSK